MARDAQGKEATFVLRVESLTPRVLRSASLTDLVSMRMILPN
jgi:hypothetical protein